MPIAPAGSSFATPEGPIAAVTFTINRDRVRYAGRLPEAQVAAVIARAAGALGPCCNYLFSTVEHLREIGLADRRLERLAGEVRALRAGAMLGAELGST